jgi:hypothetical protein
MRIKRGAFDVYTPSTQAPGYTMWFRESFMPKDNGVDYQTLEIFSMNPQTSGEFEATDMGFGFGGGALSTRILISPKDFPIVLRLADFPRLFDFRFRLDHIDPEDDRNCSFRLRWLP